MINEDIKHIPYHAPTLEEVKKLRRGFITQGKQVSKVKRLGENFYFFTVLEQRQ